MTTDDAGSAPDADADPTRLSSPATEPAPPDSTPPGSHRRQRRQAAGAAWRRWRRSRPFWGGLLLVLSGLELLALPLTGVLVKGQIKLVIYIGIGGVFGVLIGILLIAAGIVLWVNPTHRVFYGIAGIVLGIISFPASNLGGFVLGMLLAIIGGALAFAWVPAEPDRSTPSPAGRAGDDAPKDRDDRGGEPSAGLGLITEPRAEWEGTATIAEEAAPGSDGGGRSRRRRGRAPDAGGRRDAGPAGGRDARHRRGGQGGVDAAARRGLHPRHHLPAVGVAHPDPVRDPDGLRRRARRRPRRPRRPPPPARPRRPRPVQSGTAAPSATPSTSASASPSPSGTSTSAEPAAQGQEGRPEGRRGAIGHHRLRRRLGAHGRVGHPDRFPVPGQRDHARVRRRRPKR